MRVLSVSNFYDTHGGGLERVAGHLSREFALAGHHSAWAASDADGLPDTPAELIGMRCANPTEALTGLPMPIPGPKAARKLAHAVKSSDLVVVHDALYVTSILAMLLAKANRKPVILIQHIARIPFANPVMRAIMRLANAIVTRPMMAAADQLVFISDTVRNDLLGKPPRRQSQLIFNGVDQATFNPAERASRDEIRSRWKLPTSATVVIFVGRFVEKKGLSIIREMARLRPDTHFALLGKGPIKPEEWGQANVHILGHLPQDTIADLYRAGDALLLPSVGEGYPLVVQEAMACGLPVICGRDSALADPQATQWLTGVDITLSEPTASAKNCAAALDRLDTTSADRKSMADYAARNYCWRHMAGAILRLAQGHAG